MFTELQSAGGGGGTLEYDGYTSGDVTTTSLTIPSNHDALLLVTRSVTENTYVPTYNGVTYSWKLGNNYGGYVGAALIIPNVKAGTSITFASATSFAAFGYSFT